MGVGVCTCVHVYARVSVHACTIDPPSSVPDQSVSLRPGARDILGPTLSPDSGMSGGDHETTTRLREQGRLGREWCLRRQVPRRPVYPVGRTRTSGPGRPVWERSSLLGYTAGSRRDGLGVAVRRKMVPPTVLTEDL